MRTQTYDPLMRAQTIRIQNAADEVLMDYGYEYDAVGNITRKATLDGAYDYGYDALDRLTRATPPPSLIVSPGNPDGLPDEAYTYDNVHNRLTSAHQPGPWIYNANNELKQWGVGDQLKTISYDDNGSTIKEETGNPASATREYTLRRAGPHGRGQGQRRHHRQVRLRPDGPPRVAPDLRRRRERYLVLVLG